MNESPERAARSVKVSEVVAFEAGQESKQEEVDRLKKALREILKDCDQKEYTGFIRLISIRRTASQALGHAKGEE